MRVGFIGLGAMGLPMARNLSRKFALTVWNRNHSKYMMLSGAELSIAESPSMVVEQSDVTFIMLLNTAAIESVLDDDFKRALCGKVLVVTSSVTVAFSHWTAEQVHQAGGQYIEMPVSGSTVPAQQGQLVGMLAGDLVLVNRIRPVLEPITRCAIYCGPIGSGLKAKFAVNTFLITLTTGLAESVNLARAQGLDLRAFGQVLRFCPMASAYSDMKIGKLLNEDWAPQAAIDDCYAITKLIQSAASDVDTRSPLIDACAILLEEGKNASLGDEDIVAISKLLGRSQETL
ncbi:unnamed protein product [Penicillium salamii]|nr:unnamed protein product [Penicillium salamii]